MSEGISKNPKQLEGWKKRGGSGVRNGRFVVFR